MEKFIKFFTFSLFAALIVFASCGGDDDDDDNDTDPREEIADLLTGGEWQVDPASLPTLESVEAEGWENLTLTITGDKNGGSFNTTGSPEERVWPGSGTWEFADANGRKITRNDDLEVDVTVSETSLRLEFTVPEQRTLGIVGRWVFSFVRQP